MAVGADPIRYAVGTATIGRDSSHAIALGWLKDGDTVLDVGCNTGYVGRAARQRLRVIFDGIEGDAEAAALARDAYRRVVCADVTSVSPWPEVGGDYDVVQLVSHGMRRRAAALWPGLLAYQFVVRLIPAA